MNNVFSLLPPHHIFSPSLWSSVCLDLPVFHLWETTRAQWSRIMKIKEQPPRALVEPSNLQNKRRKLLKKWTKANHRAIADQGRQTSSDISTFKSGPVILQGWTDGRLRRSRSPMSAEKITDQIRQQFYWPCIKGSVAVYCKQCDLWTARKTPKSQTHAHLGRYQVGEPMERMALDVLRPLPTSRKGNRYVLVIADLFIKWTEAFPLPNQDTKTVASVFVHEFVCRFDTPLQIRPG